MEENLLTSEEVQQILSFVSSSPWLRHPDVVSIGINKTDVIKVTPTSGVIIIKGDKDTGFDHIKARHDFWSTGDFWKLSDEEVKIENPSLFSRRSIPIIDYVNIAEKVFHPNNLDSSKNKRPEVFDLYSAKVDDENNGSQVYILLTYKNTSILHTLFPKTKANNHTQKAHKILPYRKGEMKGEIHSNPTVVTMGLPYYDINGKPCYSFEIYKYVEEKREEGIIRDLEMNTQMVIFERPLADGFKLNVHSLEHEMGRIFYSDLTPIEKIIKRHDELKKRL